MTNDLVQRCSEQQKKQKQKNRFVYCIIPNPTSLWQEPPQLKTDCIRHPIQSVWLQSAKSSHTIKKMSSVFNSRHQGFNFTNIWWGGGKTVTHWCIAYISNKIFMNTRTHTHQQLILYTDLVNSSSFATWKDDLERIVCFFGVSLFCRAQSTQL